MGTELLMERETKDVKSLGRRGTWPRLRAEREDFLGKGKSVSQSLEE